jgi:hypothetical protein
VSDAPVRTRANERHLRLHWAQQLAYVAQSMDDLSGDFAGLGKCFVQMYAVKIGELADKLSDPEFGDVA